MNFVDGGCKSRIAAGLLGIFLGGFGVHRFYLGYIE
jgi:TM2 domain-containing membrane protein YozV